MDILKPEFAKGDQEDAEEALSFILTELHNELMVDNGATVNVSKNSSPWLTYISANNSPVSEGCHGLLESGLFCQEGHRLTEKSETFTMLQLAFADKETGNHALELDEMIRHNMLPEELNGCIRFCRKCQQNSTACKMPSFLHCPDSFIFHLGRFSNDLRKVETPVSFPLRDLNLSEYCSPADDASPVPLYDLSSVIYHRVLTDKLSHYTAAVKDNKGVWWCCNDERVSVISQDQIVTSDAYVLVYKKRDVSSSDADTTLLA